MPERLLNALSAQRWANSHRDVSRRLVDLGDQQIVVFGSGDTQLELYAVKRGQGRRGGWRCNDEDRFHRSTSHDHDVERAVGHGAALGDDDFHPVVRHGDLVLHGGGAGGI